MLAFLARQEGLEIERLGGTALEALPDRLAERAQFRLALVLTLDEQAQRVAQHFTRRIVHPALDLLLNESFEFGRQGHIHVRAPVGQGALDQV